MTLETIIALLPIAALLAFWWRYRAANEAIRNIIRQRCRELGLQLLDDTVYQYRLGCQWQRRGLVLIRHFRFDFSADGEHRYTGQVVVYGGHIGELQLPPHRVA